uniref:Uncharacterized protein n=1 Tax=Arundo donax TaxID=35708 RepID=A0A0A8YLT4_ARUDO
MQMNKYATKLLIKDVQISIIV